MELGNLLRASVASRPCAQEHPPAPQAPKAQSPCAVGAFFTLLSTVLHAHKRYVDEIARLPHWETGMKADTTPGISLL